MTEECDSEYAYGRYGTSLIMNQFCTDTNIELLLKVLPGLDKVKYELIDITKYHKMTLKEIEKELGYKIKLIEK